MATLPAFGKWGGELVLAGTGPYKSVLEARVKRENLSGRVRFLGRVPDHTLSSLYHHASCTIQPSLFETQGLTVLESMACGTPACVRAGTAMAEVVKPGVSGEQFDEDVPDALEVVIDLCEKHRRYAVGCRKMALGYSIPACTAKLLAAYKQVLE